MVSGERPEVLFVCVHNAGRSQMAAGLLSKLAGERISVRSAGSEPADAINPAAVIPGASKYMEKAKSLGAVTGKVGGKDVGALPGNALK